VVRFFLISLLLSLVAYASEDETCSKLFVSREYTSNEKFKNDVNEIDEGVFLSGVPRRAEFIDALGVERVICVSRGDSTYYSRNLPHSIPFVHLPFEDLQAAPKEVIQLAVLELAHARKQGQKVLVHCLYGASRSPTVVAMYLMARYNLSWETAVDKIQQLRACVEPFSGLVSAETRREIVAAVRDFLNGNDDVLQRARAQFTDVKFRE